MTETDLPTVNDAQVEKLMRQVDDYRGFPGFYWYVLLHQVVLLGAVLRYTDSQDICISDPSPRQGSLRSHSG
jgi:hypothetical protein